MSKVNTNQLKNPEKTKNILSKIRAKECLLNRIKREFQTKKESLENLLRNYKKRKREGFYKVNPQALLKFEKNYFFKTKELDDLRLKLHKTQQRLNKLYENTTETDIEELRQIKEKITRLEKSIWLNNYLLSGKVKDLQKLRKVLREKKENNKDKKKLRNINQKEKIKEISIEINNLRKRLSKKRKSLEDLRKDFAQFH
jgi:hypothetical protein